MYDSGVSVRGIAAVLGLVVAGGCERASHEPDPVTLPVPDVKVILVDAGAMPRAALRFHPRAGETVISRYTRRTDIDRGSRHDVRVLTEKYDVVAVEVRPGSIHTRGMVGDAAIEPPLRTFDAGELIGTVQERWYDPRGVHLRPTLIRNDRRDPATFVSRPELLGVLPEQAVGVGARWHEDIAYGASSASVDIQLVERDGDRVRERLDYKAEHHSAREWVTVSGTTTLDLDLGSVDATYHGENALVLHHPRGDENGTETIDVVRVVR